MDIWEPERCSMPGNNRGARRQRKLIIYQNPAGDSTGMLFFLGKGQGNHVAKNIQQAGWASPS
jgi:hypothetical protein